MKQNYTGVIIEESLESTSILDKINIVSTEVEKVTPEHKTPWIDKWTMHDVEIDFRNVESVSSEISKLLDSERSWYADFKNDKKHYIIFKNKVFSIDRTKKEEYEEGGTAPIKVECK